MKTRNASILTCLLGVAMLLLPAVVQAQFTFTTNNDAITITGFTGNPTTLNIPNITNGYPVTVIGDGAFANCASLTNITIGTNVTTIGISAFYDCTSLMAITVNSTNPAFSSLAGVLFDKSQSKLIVCPGGATGSYTVPNSVTNIGDNAFNFCVGLKSVIVGDSVVSIADLAFANSTSLTNVTIGTNATSISSDAFDACTDLKTITVDSNNPAYSSVDGILFNKNQTTLIECPGGKTGNYLVPNSVTSIGETAFFECPNLVSITVGNSVTNIGGSAFSGCTSLTNVTIGTNVTSIGVNAFYVCPSLMAIMVNSNNPAYSSVAGVLFDKNQTMLIAYPETKAGSYAIPDSVTNIGANAFADCMNLQNIIIPNSVISIGGGAFRYCVSLTSITIPGSVTNIGFIAFNNCSGLTGVYFQGNAPTPTNDSSVFSGDNNGTVYYLLGTISWGSTFDGLPAVRWNPQAQNDASFGVQSNQFGFNITGSSNLVIVVEACTNLANPVWLPVSTNTLNTFVGTNGTSYFSDPEWTNYPGRFYRLRSP